MVKAVDFSILDRYREAVTQMKEEERQAKERAKAEARERAIAEETRERMRIAPFFGLPSDPEGAIAAAKKDYKE